MATFKNLKPQVFTAIENPTQADLKRAREDFPFFCGSFLKIKPKKDIITNGKSLGPLIPFNFNPPQQAVWNLMKEMIREGTGIKLIVLKRNVNSESVLFSVLGSFG
jgi:hypothetical protein